MRPWLPLIATAVILSGPVQPAMASDKATAKSLVEDMRRAVAYIGKAVKADSKSLNPKIKKQEPFFAALKKTSLALDRLEKDVAGKKKDAFKSMHAIGKDVRAVELAWKMAGVPNRQVSEGVTTLANAYDALSTSYGKGAVRKKKGGALSAAEKAQAEKIKAKGQTTLTSLKGLKAKTKNPAVAAEIDALIAETARVADAALTLEAYLDLLEAIEVIEARWSGLNDWVVVAEPGLVADFRTVDIEIETYETVYYEVDSSFVVEDTSYFETEVTIETDVEVEISETEVETYEEYVEEREVEVQEESVEVEEEESTEEEGDEMEGEEESSEEVEADEMEGEEESEGGEDEE